MLSCLTKPTANAVILGNSVVSDPIKVKGQINGRAALSGSYSSVFPDLWWVIGYAAVIMAIAVLAFKSKMNSDNV